MRINTTLVINSKGGSGKTTVTTNIASYFAARKIPTAIVAYRARASMPVYQPLERVRSSRSLTSLTRLGDSDAYVNAAETGVGLFEFDASMSGAERPAFMPIGRWVEGAQKPGADATGSEV